MITHYSVSGHGWDDASGGEFSLPADVKVHFYVKSGEVLPVVQAVDMWDKLKANPSALGYAEVGYVSVHSMFGHDGKEPPIIQRWITKKDCDFDSGIWRHNPPTELFMDKMQAEEYVTLEDIVKFIRETDKPEGTIEIHWIACRIHY